MEKEGRPWQIGRRGKPQGQDKGGDDSGTPPGSWDVLLSAAWFGLVVGLLESGLLLALKPLRDRYPPDLLLR